MMANKFHFTLLFFLSVLNIFASTNEKVNKDSRKELTIFWYQYDIEKRNEKTNRAPEIDLGPYIIDPNQNYKHLDMMGFFGGDKPIIVDDIMRSGGLKTYIDDKKWKRIDIINNNNFITYEFFVDQFTEIIRIVIAEKSINGVIKYIVGPVNLYITSNGSFSFNHEVEGLELHVFGQITTHMPPECNLLHYATELDVNKQASNSLHSTNLAYLRDELIQDERQLSPPVSLDFSITKSYRDNKHKIMNNSEEIKPLIDVENAIYVNSYIVENGNIHAFNSSSESGDNLYYVMKVDVDSIFNTTSRIDLISRFQKIPPRFVLSSLHPEYEFLTWRIADYGCNDEVSFYIFQFALYADEIINKRISKSKKAIHVPFSSTK